MSDFSPVKDLVDLTDFTATNHATISSSKDVNPGPRVKTPFFRQFHDEMEDFIWSFPTKADKPTMIEPQPLKPVPRQFSPATSSSDIWALTDSKPVQAFDDQQSGTRVTPFKLSPDVKPFQPARSPSAASLNEGRVSPIDTLPPMQVPLPVTPPSAPTASKAYTSTEPPITPADTANHSRSDSASSLTSSTNSSGSNASNGSNLSANAPPFVGKRSIKSEPTRVHVTWVPEQIPMWKYKDGYLGAVHSSPILEKGHFVITTRSASSGPAIASVPTAAYELPCHPPGFAPPKATKIRITPPPTPEKVNRPQDGATSPSKDSKVTSQKPINNDELEVFVRPEAELVATTATATQPLHKANQPPHSPNGDSDKGTGVEKTVAVPSDSDHISATGRPGKPTPQTGTVTPAIDLAHVNQKLLKVRLIELEHKMSAIQQLCSTSAVSDSVSTIDSSHSISAPAVYDMQTQAIKELEARIIGLRAEKDAIEVEKDTIKAGWTSSLLELKRARLAVETAKKLSMGIAAQCEAAEEANVRLKSMNDKPPFVVVLLDATEDMFDEDLLRQEYEGGRKTSRRIHDRVEAVFEARNGSKIAPTVALQVFVDIPIVRKELEAQGILQGSTFRFFLEGLQAEHPLNTVVDVMDDEQATAKMSAQVALHLQNTPCAMVVIGSKNAKPYQYLSRVSTRRNTIAHRLFAIRTCPDLDEEPFAEFGVDRLIPCPVLYAERRNKVHPSQRLRATAHSPTILDSTSSSRAPSILEAPTSYRYGAQPALQSIISTRRPSPASTIRALAEDGRQPAPSMSTVPRMGERRGGNSLLDRYHAIKAAESIRESQTSHSPAASNTTHRPRSEAATAIVVPVTETMVARLGDSPPSSDEDQPSVTIPHSAAKFVQRPISFSQEGSPHSSFRSLSTASVASTYSSMSIISDDEGSIVPSNVNGQPHHGSPSVRTAITRKHRGGKNRAPGAPLKAGSVAPSLTSTNTIPLGSRRKEHGIV